MRMGTGSRSASDYLTAFSDKLADYHAAGYVLQEDAEAMRRRAALCRPLTFTESYRDHYARFVAIERCDH
jgi:hypothetical protein